MDIFDGSTRKYNAQYPQTLKNRKISCFTWQNFVSELFDSWWNPRSTISLPTSFHTFFALVRPLKCCSKYCKSCVFRILHLRLIPLVNKKGNFTKIILWKERTNDFYLRVAMFLFRTLWDLHCEVRSERLWKQIIHPIRDTNDNTSQCKSQGVGNKKAFSWFLIVRAVKCLYVTRDKAYN